MKKKLLGPILVLVVLAAARVAYVSAFGIHLSPEDFIDKAGERDQSGSMFLLAYDGVRDGRAYLRSWEMNRIPRSIDYWTEVEGLPADVRERIEAETGRWIVERPGSPR